MGLHIGGGIGLLHVGTTIRGRDVEDAASLFGWCLRWTLILMIVVPLGSAVFAVRVTFWPHNVGAPGLRGRPLLRAAAGLLVLGFAAVYVWLLYFWLPQWLDTRDYNYSG